LGIELKSWIIVPLAAWPAWLGAQKSNALRSETPPKPPGKKAPIEVVETYPGGPKVGMLPVIVEHPTVVEKTLYYVARNNRLAELNRFKPGMERPAVVYSTSVPAGSPHIDNLTPYSGGLFFTSGPMFNELWRTDGLAGAEKVATLCKKRCGVCYPQHSAYLRGRLFFAADTGKIGWEPFVGDEKNARLMEDLMPGYRSSNPREFVSVQGGVVFVAEDPVHGRELRFTDGVSVRLLKDIFPGKAGADPESLTVHENLIYFSADDGKNGRELWVSDGTEEGTRLFKELYPGRTGAAPKHFTPYKDGFLFTANAPKYGRELWKCDGTPAGTVMTEDLYPGSVGSNPEMLVATERGKVYFTAYVEKQEGRGLFATGGGFGGATLIKTLKKEDGPEWLAPVGENVYFFMTARRELWTSDGTPENVRRVWKLPKNWDVPSSPVGFANALYFVTADGKATLICKTR
jgi:ELWxxDGT repeat protein